MVPKGNRRIKCVVLSSTILILIFNISCCFAVKVSHSSLHYVGIDSFVSKAAFWIIKYVLPNFTNYLCIFIVQKYKTIYRVINDLFKINENIKDINIINSNHIFVKLYVFIISLAFVSLIILEMLYNNTDFLSLWCTYVPCIIVNLYAAANALIIEMCAIRIKNINEVLKKFSKRYLIDKIIEIQSISCGDRKNNTNDLFHNFAMYGRMYNIVCEINKMGGLIILIYLMIGIMMGLSITYSYITKNDVTNYSNFPYKVNLSREYCFISFSLGLWLLTSISDNIQNEAERTGLIVYELVHCNPDTNEEITLHGLQILNQKIQIAAAGLFTINFDITPEIIILFVTHLSVFIQINEYYQ